jgi:arylsulfatase A-like enzyme
MSRAAALRGGLALALAVGSAAGAVDLVLHRLHPALAFGRSATLGVVALYVVPALLTACVVALGWPRVARRVLVALLPALALLVIVGGAVNVVWLPSLLSPSSLFFDFFALVFAGAVGYRLYVGAPRPRSGGFFGFGAAVVVLTALLAWWPTSSTRGESPTSARGEKHDIVVILLDALRADHCSLYGYQRATTPHLDALAQTALVFENAYAPSSWTKPSVASLFTGVHPASHGNHLISSQLPKGLPTLTELMHLAGYETAIFAENAFVSPLFGYGRGADHVVANEPDVPAQSIAGHLLQQVTVRQRKLEPLLTVARWSNHLDPRQRFKRHGGFDIVEAFDRWLGKRGDESIFAYVHLMKPHAPYVCPPPYDGAFGELSPHDGDSPVRPPHVEGIGPFARAEGLLPHELERLIANYDERILYGDAMLGDLLAALQRVGRYEDASIFVVADHGEEFGENGLYDHGHSLQEGVLRIPFVLKPPRERGLVGRRSETVQLLDLPATVLPLAGLDLPAHFAGRDLLWQIEEGALQSEGVFAQLRHGPGYEMEGWIDSGHKIVQTHFDKKSRRQLFDLLDDPTESNELSTREERAQWEQALKDAHERAARYLQADTEAVLDQHTLEHLRALGYVR